MNAEQFFEKYSIEEISKKTKISPISLRFIRNKEFDKIPRVKFFGFLNIIEKEFNVDLSDLKEEYNNFNPQKDSKPTQEIKIETSKNKNFLLIILAIILLIIGGFLLYKENQQKSTQPKSQTELNISNDINSTNTTKQIQNNPISNNTNSNNTNEKNLTLQTPKKESNTTIKKYQVIIIPQKEVWFRAINIDTNKTIEYLTSKEKILPKGNYYIKFGHGEITINYNNQTITPDTKKIVRILFKNGTYKFMKKPNRYEK